MSLEVSEKIEIFSLGSQNPQKWISHTQKPIPRHLKIQNPSNGSKVMGHQNLKKFRSFPKLWIHITFEPFDQFWIFKKYFNFHQFLKGIYSTPKNC